MFHDFWLVKITTSHNYYFIILSLYLSSSSKATSSSPFGLFLQSGEATAYYLSSNRPVFNFRLLRTNFPISSFTTSKNLLFGLALFLFPENSISIIFLPTYSCFLRITCPYHLILSSLIFIPNCSSTLTVLLMYSFLILTFLVTPIANLNIFISATSISFTRLTFFRRKRRSHYLLSEMSTSLLLFWFLCL